MQKCSVTGLWAGPGFGSDGADSMTTNSGGGPSGSSQGTGTRGAGAWFAFLLSVLLAFVLRFAIPAEFLLPVGLPVSLLYVGATGFLFPREPWRWALVVVISVTFISIVDMVIEGKEFTQFPLLIIVFVIFFALLAAAAYGGAMLRRVLWPR